MQTSKNEQATYAGVQNYEIGKYLTHNNLFQMAGPFNIVASLAEI